MSGTPQAAEIDVRTLDVGAYQTTPMSKLLISQKSLSGGTQLAIMRLADHVVLSTDIDPSLKFGAGIDPMAPGQPPDMMPPEDWAVAGRNDVLFGVGSRGTEDDPEHNVGGMVTVYVAQFPDADAARRTVTEFTARPEPVALPNYPSATAHWRPEPAMLESSIAQGRYLIGITLSVPGAEPARIIDLVQRAYARQIPLLDSLPPLSRADLQRLPNDPDDILRRTLNLGDQVKPDANRQATYGIPGFLHFLYGDRQHWQQIVTATGTDRFSYSYGTMMFRTRDDDGAARLQPEPLFPAYLRPADPPPILPDARCGERAFDRPDAKRFRCTVRYHRYVAVVESNQIQDIYQRAAAQYAVLANSR
ncbi:DUF7373 family lipoprotein [Nocardia panacis]|uniref:DUF7373 family lipoprotein n=1 Tax=Nocardia panacis TaxID=2340916 RepID=UPI0011C47701|nr:hypothetical protein [Nocardia panacis]